MVFEKDARVQALASLFDAGTEDAQGRTYSQKRTANGLGDYCFGTITRVYRVGRNAEGKYMVKWDEGTSTSLVERHLTLAAGIGAAVTNADDETAGLTDYVTRDGDVTDDENEDVDDEGAPAPMVDAVGENEAVITPLNGLIQCGEYRWRRVKAIVADPRAEHPEFEFAIRNVSVNENTSLNDIFWLCMPVSRSELLETVRFRAGTPNPIPIPITQTLP